MTSLVIYGDTSGSITLQANAIAGTNTLTLPANTGVLLSNASSINANSITTGTLPSARLPAGSILQVLSATDTVERPTTSTSFVANSNLLTVTITPRSSSSRFFVSVSTCGYKNTDGFGVYTIYRDSTNLGNASSGFTTIQPAGYYPISMCITDSPATTSNVTYQVYYRMTGGTGNAYLNAGTSGNPATGTITVMEIAG